MKAFGLILAVAILMFGFSAPEKETVFKGRVILNSQDIDYSSVFIIEFRMGASIIARAGVKRDSTYEINVKTNKTFDVYYHGVSIPLTYQQTVDSTSEDTILLNLRIPKDYKFLSGKAICPKCSKYDQTIPISYGLKEKIVYVRRINKKGDTKSTTDYKNEYYDGGCTTSDIAAKYHCKRDKIEF